MYYSLYDRLYTIYGILYDIFRKLFQSPNKKKGSFMYYLSCRTLHIMNFQHFLVLKMKKTHFEFQRR